MAQEASQNRIWLCCKQAFSGLWWNCGNQNCQPPPHPSCLISLPPPHFVLFARIFQWTNNWNLASQPVSVKQQVYRCTIEIVQETIRIPAYIAYGIALSWRIVGAERCVDDWISVQIVRKLPWFLCMPPFKSTPVYWNTCNLPSTTCCYTNIKLLTQETLVNSYKRYRLISFSSVTCTCMCVLVCSVAQ